MPGTTHSASAHSASARAAVAASAAVAERTDESPNRVPEVSAARVLACTASVAAVSTPPEESGEPEDAPSADEPHGARNRA